MAGTAHLVLRGGKTIFSEAAGLSDIGDKTPFKFAALDPAASSPFNNGLEFLSGGGGLISTLPDFAGRQFATIYAGLNSEANAPTPSALP